MVQNFKIQEIVNKVKIILILFIIMIYFNGCGTTKQSEDDNLKEPKQVYEPNVDKRIDKHKGKLIDKMIGKKSSNNSSIEFASSNPMWRASLQVLKEIPLVSTDYVSGIIITDWYSNGSKESIKININFISDTVAVSSIVVTAFKRTCESSNECIVVQSPESFTKSIKDKIISQIKEIKILEKKKNS